MNTESMNSPTEKTEIVPNCDSVWDYAEIYSEYCLMRCKLSEMFAVLKTEKAEQGNPETDFELCKGFSEIKQQCEEVIKCLSEPQQFQTPTERLLERQCNQNNLIVQRLEAISEQITPANISLLTIKTNLALLTVQAPNEQQQM